MRERQLGFATELAVSVTFSGLALSGKILFPVKKSEDQVKNEKEASDNRKVLLNAARSGDQTAIETLTLDDIDTYSLSLIHIFIPDDLDYNEVKSLRIEAKQKLTEMRPSSIGQASRISGVSPADISVLLVYLESR